jgi:tetratricopeptide (TPR) repeat protein
VDAVSGQVAVHYDRAGDVEHAALWHERAADAAQHLYASADAVRFLDRALELVQRLQKTPERSARELAIATSLVVLLGWVEGFASPRVDRAQRHALALSRELRMEVAPSLLRSTAMFSLSHEQFEEAEHAGAELRARGDAGNDDVLVVEGEYVLGIAAFWKGNLESAREHFETAVARCLPDQVREHLQRYGQDPRIICLSRLANTLWYLGQAAEALSARDAALSMADALAHPQSRATALVFATMLALEMRDWAKLREYVAALAAPLTAQSTKAASVAIQAFSGFIEVLDGRALQGIARIRGALAEAEQEYHAPGNRSCIERVLVEALAQAGEAHAGLSAVDRALDRGAGVRVFEAEMRRARAGFLAAVGD